MSLDTFGVLQLKAVERMQGCVTEHQRLQGMFNARAKRDREVYFNKLADEAQEGLRHNNLCPSGSLLARAFLHLHLWYTRSMAPVVIQHNMSCAVGRSTSSLRLKLSGGLR